MSKVKPTYQNVIGFYIEPVERPVWDGLVADPKTGELVKEPSMTKQSFKDECDINNIVKRFEATGQIDHINQAAARGVYQDLPEALDLQRGLNIIAQAEEAFMALPADARAAFDNDPVKFVAAAYNPSEENQKLFIRLGLAKHLEKADPSIEVPPKTEVPPEPKKE